jgi:ubiquinol-cytochrome c reductase cytochrome b subunit
VIRATLTRFYTFHFLFPFLVLGLVLVHLFLLHITRSSNPIGLWTFNKLHFYPIFLLKDLVTFVLIFLILIIFSFSYPLIFIDADNWIECNPIVTPTHIKPEWYFLFAYAILRCIPNKAVRVLRLLLSVTYAFVFSLNSINFYTLFVQTFWSKLFFWFFFFFFVL